VLDSGSARVEHRTDHCAAPRVKLGEFEVKAHVRVG
jgi:hypothetical protein